MLLPVWPFSLPDLVSHTLVIRINSEQQISSIFQKWKKDFYTPYHDRYSLLCSDANSCLCFQHSQIMSKEEVRIITILDKWKTCMVVIW